MNRDVVVAARDLSWNVRGRHILGPIDLDVERGEFLAVIGQNGAGKTTLLRLMTRVIQPSAGGLYYKGETYASLPRRQLARGLAYLPQKIPTVVPLTVEEVVLLGRFPYLSSFQIAPAATDRAAVDGALASVGIDDMRRRPLNELSGGERQLAYLAACLAQEAEVVVLDEPTTFLDPRHQRQIALVLRRLARDQGITVVAATHDLNFASLMADRVASLNRGRLVACEPPAKLFTPGPLDRVFSTPFDFVARGERPLALVKLDD